MQGSRPVSFHSMTYYALILLQIRVGTQTHWAHLSFITLVLYTPWWSLFPFVIDLGICKKLSHPPLQWFNSDWSIFIITNWWSLATYPVTSYHNDLSSHQVILVTRPMLFQGINLLRSCPFLGRLSSHNPPPDEICSSLQSHLSISPLMGHTVPLTSSSGRHHSEIISLPPLLQRSQQHLHPVSPEGGSVTQWLSFLLQNSWPVQMRFFTMLSTGTRDAQWA